MSRAAAALVLLALLAHGLGLANGFVFDDHRFVVENQALQTVDVSDALLDPSTHTADLDRDVYRPLRTLGHAFDRRRWGLEAFGFHLHSLLAHVVNVLLAWVVLRHLLGPDGETGALLGAGLLAVHPLGVEVVGWISSRGDLYALGWGLVALGLGTGLGTGLGSDRESADDDRRTTSRNLDRAALLGAALAAGLATLGKESAAVLPLVAFLHGRLTGRGPRWGPAWMLAGVALAMTIRQIALQGATPVQTPPHGGDHVQQVGWAIFGLGRMVGALLVPNSLAVEYPQHLWGGQGAVWIRPAFLGGLLALASPWALRKLGGATSAFLAAWALVAYLPSSSLIITLRDLVNDRGAYPVLPAAGALLGWSLRTRPRWAHALLLVGGLWLAALSIERTNVFRDDKSLWQDVLRQDRTSVRAHLGLAAVAPDESSAHALLLRAVDVAIPGSKPEAIALARMGEHLLRRSGDPAHAIPVLERALQRNRHWAQVERSGLDLLAVTSSLAEALELMDRSEEAEAVIEAGLEEDVARVPLRVKRVLLRQLRAERSGDPEDAAAVLEAIREAEAEDPEHALVKPLRVWLDRRKQRGISEDEDAVGKPPGRTGQGG